MIVYAEVRWRNRSGNYARPEEQKQFSLVQLLGSGQHSYVFGVPFTESRSNSINSRSEAETFKQETEDNYKQHPTYLAHDAGGRVIYEDGRAVAEWMPEIRIVEEPSSELKQGGSALGGTDQPGE